jgi:choline kinase
MKALILAAGQGTRIRSLHGEHPKCLITFNNSDWTILDQQIHSIWLAGINDIAIVVGYEKDP